MTRTRLSVLTAAFSMALAGAAFALPGVPDVKVPAGLPGGNKIPGGNPMSCDDLSAAGAVGVRVQAFMSAAAAVDQQAAELEGSVLAACKSMAVSLGISSDGNTQKVCGAVAAELKKALKASVKIKGKAYAKFTPAQCTVNAKAEASMSGQCEGSGAAGGSAGTGGTGGGAAGQAECKAAAKARANVEASCTPAKVELAWDSKAVIDASRADKAAAAIKAGLPVLLQAAARAQMAQKAVVQLAASAKGMAKATGSVGKAFGAKAMCVVGRLSGSVKAAASAAAHVNVSVKASVSVSASATGSGKVQ